MSDEKHKHAPVQTVFKARVQEKNEFEILCCSLLKTVSVPMSDNV